MIFIDRLKLFPFSTAQIGIDNSRASSYSIFFYPENVDFITTYEHLKIKKTHVRKIVPIASRYPRVMINGKAILPYRKLGLIVARNLQRQADNIYIDLTRYLDAVDVKFKKGNYRRNVVSSRIKEYLSGLRGLHEGRKKVLLYVVNLDEELPRGITKRRAWPILEMLKTEGENPFEYFLIAIIKNGITKYSMLGNENDSLPYTRIRNILKSLISTKTDFISQDEAMAAADLAVGKIDIVPNDDMVVKLPNNKTTDEIISDTEDTVTVDPIIEKTEEERDTIRYAVANYLKAMPPQVRRSILSRSIDKNAATTLATKSILFSVSGDLKKSNETVETVVPERRKYMLDQVKKELLSDVVKRDPPQNNNRDLLHSKVDIHGLVEHKDPSHILNKRQLDFATSFEKDLLNSFKLLEKKDYPLKLFSMKKEPIPSDPGDLNPSLYDRYIVVLQDDKKNKHEVEIQIPRLMGDGTFLINGKKKYLTYQIILDPIFFVKKGQAKLETLYAVSTIYLKKTVKKQYFQILIGGYKLPLIVLMGYYIGFKKTCRLFGVKYKIVDTEPPEGINYLILSDGNFIVVDYKTDAARILLNSFAESPNIFTEDNLEDQKTFEQALIKITGNRNSTWKVKQVLDNIMEPVATQVLKSKLLPFTYPQIVLYICEELVKERVDDRNDISKQRIRTSEVFAHQIQKLILGSYTDYRERRISGFKDAEYKLDVTEAIKRIVNSKLMDDLENINPTEELSCLTRLKPIGEGGIPDSNAITKQARNIHPTYYGNIDSMDTPEGENVGIINQLSVGAAITNSRGAFVDKTDGRDEKSGILGVNSVMIPFIGSCDGARVMFAGSQGRQAIPINGEEAPIVQTGYESVLTSMLSDNYVKKAISDGIVRSITTNAIVIKLKSGRLQTISLATKILRAGQGQSALNYFKPIVVENQKVKKNQIVAEGKHIQDGVISVGTNLLCAVMTWKGYSYEDGYIVSDKIAKTKLTSEAYHEIEILVKPTDRVSFINQEGVLTKRGEPLLMRISKEVEDVVGLEEDEIQQGQLITKSPGGKIISLEVYANSPISKFPALKKAHAAYKEKYEEAQGHATPKKFTARVGSEKQQFSGVLIRFKIEETQVAELGDKITNNYGGKGVIAKIEKEENMPLTPWGEHVDIILNPIAIVNRMNPSTIKELYLSLISKFMATKIIGYGPRKNDKTIALLTKVLGVLDGTKGKSYSRQVVTAVNSMTNATYQKWLKTVVDRGGFIPIIVPPFQEPTIIHIRAALRLVGAKEGYKLKIKEYGTSTSTDIAVGYLYYKKLEQQSGIKLSARSTGMVSSVTKQAMSGKGGGQRIGEMDSYSIINHGATNILREFFGPLADDHVTKDQIVADIIQTGSAEYRTPRTSPTKDLFDTYMRGMMLETDIG